MSTYKYIQSSTIRTMLHALTCYSPLLCTLCSILNVLFCTCISSYTGGNKVIYIYIYALDILNYSDIWFGIQFLVDNLLNKVCALIKEDVWKLHFHIPFSVTWSTYSKNSFKSTHFIIQSLEQISSEVSTNWSKRVRRSIRLKVVMCTL